MTSERFHRAARDGALEILKEATRKDCNARDEGGMTPTSWAAFEGHIDALRLLVAKGGVKNWNCHLGYEHCPNSLNDGLIPKYCLVWIRAIELQHPEVGSLAIKGIATWYPYMHPFSRFTLAKYPQTGDPDKADYFGNTALHLASARGHEYCVKFLVKFGCNVWSLDIDRHSARELAAINGRERVLQFLDLAQADQELNNRKKSRMMREKAEKEAEKRLKEYVKRQKTAEVKAEKEQKKLMRDRAKSELDIFHGPSVLPHRPSILTFKGRVRPSPTFSDIVGTTTKRNGSAVCRKALAKKAVDDFKIVEIEVGGQRSVRSLTGLQRDSEVMYVGTYEAQTQQLGKRGRISDVWGTLSKAQSTPDLLGDRCFDETLEEDYEDELDDNDSKGTVKNRVIREPASIFYRPGFGSVAFRRSITNALDDLPVTQADVHHPHQQQQPQQNGTSCVNGSVNGSVNGHRINGNATGHNEEISIGSAGSLARRQSMWDDDLISESDETEEEWTPLQRFLVANNLSSIYSVLDAEQIDLEALMLLTDADIAALKLPLGPRRKLTNAIANRKKALEASENIITDSRL